MLTTALRAAPTNLSRFPLAISSNGRYFVDRFGKPFFFLMDAAWEAPAQLTKAQIDHYLADRKSRGFTFTIIELTELLYSSQSPTYLNQNGDSPFSTITAQGTSPFGASACDFSTAGGSYWTIPDYYIKRSRDMEMGVVAFPAYTGFPTTPRQGWYDCIIADTAAHLQAFGQFCALRYPRETNGHIIWGASGDNSLSQSDLDQHWNIIKGITAIDPNALVYLKGQRHTSGYALATTNGGLSRYPGLNINNAYVSNSSGTSYTQASDCIAEYNRATAPYFVDETDYDFAGVATPNDCRRALWCGWLSGAAGVSYGNEMLWGFGCANNQGTIGPAAALTDTYCNTTAVQHCTVFANFVRPRQWHNYVPKTDTSLITTSQGTGAATICGAISADGTEACIYTGSGTGFTIALSALSISSFKARWLDPTNGAITIDSTQSNSGTHAFTTPGTNAGGDSDWVLSLAA